MAREETRSAASAGESPRATAALGIAGLAVVLFIVSLIVAQEGNDWLWPLTGLVGLVAAVLGQAGRPRPRKRALIATVVGGLLFVLVAGWGIIGAITGNL